jgi:hypothetical protein
MSGGGALRLFHCRSSGPAFDERLRTTIAPGLGAMPGSVRVWAARHGIDDEGLRLVASTWESAEAMRLGLEDAGAPMNPETDATIAAPRVETYPILQAAVDRASLETGILRLARGVLRDVEPALYAERVIAGLEADRQGGHGPNALVLAQTGEREFVTVTVWSGWQHVEIATGASIRDPIRTKRGAELVSFVAEHYELLADLT